MANFKLAFVALLLEISSWTVSGFLTQSSDSALWGYLALHALASAVLAFSMLPLLLGKHTQPRWAVVGLIACFCFAIPVLGFVLAFLAVMTVRVYPSRDPTEDFSSVVLPEFDQHQHLPGTAQTSGIRSLLSNREAPTKLRFKALVTLSHVKGRIASPLLRDVLDDPSDDLRLLAYGMLDRMEQKLSRAIHEELQVLKEEASGPAALSPGLVAAHRLSDLYWELLYQELASDDMHDFAVQESLRYCDMVLRQQPTTAAGAARDRLLHAMDRQQEAEQCYARAWSWACRRPRSFLPGADPLRTA
jgi:phosphate/sulfate permease